MNIEIVVPAAGESVTEADVARWFKEDGAFLELDEPMVELETDKASLTITAPAAGILHSSHSSTVHALQQPLCAARQPPTAALP